LYFLTLKSSVILVLFTQYTIIVFLLSISFYFLNCLFIFSIFVIYIRFFNCIFSFNLYLALQLELIYSYNGNISFLKFGFIQYFIQFKRKIGYTSLVLVNKNNPVKINSNIL